ncbi:hypothetical protein EW026_g1254 [Hermanssonia centrifuga]|uniref:Uncharacterized protein n=1 Tax=Hermanssonia centrifuga TaxID=98765 RepID=A0A4S4KSF4_9APHY|nr:hypothetical protein EW026_g1254 [Hermanssonia centrifuga]
MFSKSYLTFVALSVLAVSDQAFGRYQWLERDGRAVHLYPRRFGQEHPAVIDKLSAACPGQVCGTLSGQAITPLLAAQGECTQQDMADAIIDAAQQFDAATKATMIALAVEYRQAEKNTPPDFTTNPPTNRNSVFCQKAPKNAELNGLVQAQDPANDPNIFFDPAKQASVTKGSQADTSPFGTSGDASAASSVISSAAASSAVVSSVVSSAAASSTAAASAATTSGQALVAISSSADPCVVTVTVTADSSAVTDSAAASATTVASVTSAAAVATSTASSSAIGDFGSCSVPQIQFGVGFDNRKETSFEPVDQTSYNHGSAQAIGIITQFICDTLTNKCGADQTAKDTCATATTAANGQTAKTGAQADAFNAVFGISTNFAAVAEVDDQGRTVAAGTGSAATSSAQAATLVATSVAASTTADASSATSTAAASSGIGNFGKCSVPQIEFGTGFDGRKETSFEPVDKTSYNHGSAQNGDIITQFMCDTLVNTCGADQTAQATCATAKTAFDSETAKTGAQADAFNAVFGIKTNFAAVAAVDDQGNIIAGSTDGSAAASAATSAAAASTVAASSANVATSTSSSAAASAATSVAAAASGTNLQTFTGALGGVTPPAVTGSGTSFQVEGNSSFNNLANALTRSCDVQHNQCANAANASGNKGDLTVTACGDQQTQCDAAH